MNEKRMSHADVVAFKAGSCVFLLVLSTAALLAFIWPESFASTARVRATPPATGTNSDGRSDSVSSFVRMECEVIQSEIVLRPVIEKLDLNELWGRKYAGMRLKTSDTLKLLKRLLEVRPVRDTELVEIRAFSENPEQAAALANAVAESYQEMRLKPLRDEIAADPRRALMDGRMGHLPRLVIDRAMPGTRPVRPNKPLYLLIGTASGLILGLLFGIAVRCLARSLQKRY